MTVEEKHRTQLRFSMTYLGDTIKGSANTGMN